MQSLCQVDATLGAEVWTGLAGAGVEGNEEGVAGAEKEAFLLPIAPVCQAAVDETKVGGPAGLPRLGVVYPFRLAGDGIDGGSLAEGRAGIEDAIDQERCRFVDERDQVEDLEGIACAHDVVR